MPASWQRWQVGRCPLHFAFCSRQFSHARLTRPLLVQVLVLAVLGIGILAFMDRSPVAVVVVRKAPVGFSDESGIPLMSTGNPTGDGRLGSPIVTERRKSWRLLYSRPSNVDEVACGTEIKRRKRMSSCPVWSQRARIRYLAILYPFCFPGP